MIRVIGLSVCVLACFSAIAATATAQVTPTVSNRERADIVKLIRITGAMDIGMKIGTLISNKMIAVIKQVNPNISDTAIKDVQQAVTEIMTRPSTQEKLIDSIVVIYAKHFSDAEIRQLIQFYKTPLGLKIIRTMPGIAQESMAAGEAVITPLKGELIETIRENLARDHINPRTPQPEPATVHVPAS